MAPIEISHKEHIQLCKAGENTGYKCNNFSIAARGFEKGGSVVVVTNEGQPSEKRINIQLDDGKINIKALELTIRTV